MSAKGQEDPGEDLTSRVGAESPCSDMKRAAAKKLIERYFYQLTDGCGNPQCDNQHCASSGKVTNLTPNQAAAQAIQLFSQEARLCDGTQPNKVARTTIEPGPASLAKSLPVKSVNPTCSDEGIGSKLDKMNKDFEAVESNPAGLPSALLLPTVDNFALEQTACSSSNKPDKLRVTFKNVAFAQQNVVSINENSPVSKIDESRTRSSKIDEKILPWIEQIPQNSNSSAISTSTRVSSRNTKKELSNQTSNEKIINPRVREGLVSRKTSVTPNGASTFNGRRGLRRVYIPRRTYAKSVSPRKTGNGDRSKARGLREKRRIDVMNRKASRAKNIENSRQVENRQLQQLVRKLVVLTLYLRYLQVKRSARSMKF